MKGKKLKLKWNREYETVKAKKYFYLLGYNTK
jgi:hypothetical protein